MTLPSVANVIFEVPTDEPSIYYNPAPPSPDMGVRVVPVPSSNPSDPEIT
jgi:hypothetical protein